MKLLAKLFLRGLAAILPLALTAALVWWAVVAGETMLHELLLLIFEDAWVDGGTDADMVDHEGWYVPGMGFALSILLVMATGVFMYSFAVRTLYGRLTRLLEHIPVVKSVYGMIVDVVRIFGSPDERPFRRVVLVQVENSFEQIGFLTREDFDDMPEIGNRKVAVYLPMSYQLGGFTIIVDAERVRRIEMSVEDALRFCVTAGVNRIEPEE